MAFFARGIEIGANQQYDRVEFSPGHSNMARLRGALAEDMIGMAVQCAGASGKIAFELYTPAPEFDSTPPANTTLAFEQVAINK